MDNGVVVGRKLLSSGTGQKVGKRGGRTVEGIIGDRVIDHVAYSKEKRSSI